MNSAFKSELSVYDSHTQHRASPDQEDFLMIRILQIFVNQYKTLIHFFHSYPATQFSGLNCQPKYQFQQPSNSDMSSYIIPSWWC